MVQFAKVKFASLISLLFSFYHRSTPFLRISPLPCCQTGWDWQREKQDWQNYFQVDFPKGKDEGYRSSWKQERRKLPLLPTNCRNVKRQRKCFPWYANIPLFHIIPRSFIVSFIHLKLIRISIIMRGKHKLKIIKTKIG